VLRYIRLVVHIHHMLEWGEGGYPRPPIMNKQAWLYLL
jgi:hypothetical protein